MSEYLDRVPFRVQQGFSRLTSIKPEKAIPGGMRFLTAVGSLDISFFAPGVVRFRSVKPNVNDYGLLVGEPQTMACEITQSNNRVLMTSSDVDLQLNLAPFSFKLFRKGKLLLQSTTDCSMEGPSCYYAFGHGSEDKWQVSLALNSGEPVYGLGEKFGRLNHRGELITSWNHDALGVNAERSYKNCPMAWSPEGWGIFVHTPGRVKHAVGYSPWSHRSYILQIEDACLDLFLFAQKTPADILDAYTDLTGKSPSLPQWSYGAWMARAFYLTADELLDVVKGMRAKEIPLDVILLDGRAWHRPETRFDFSWDPVRYPDPAAFMRQLDKLHVRLCLWEYTYISTLNPLFNELAEKGFLLKTKEGLPYVHSWVPEAFSMMLPQLSPSGIIDLTNPGAYTWFRDQHKALFDLGVAVMKTDFGEAVPEHVVAFNGDSGKRLHNVYSLLYNRCVYEASQMYGHGKAMVWGRSGWTGSQRYPMGWGGDPQADWEGLAASIRGGQSWGMSGVPFYAHDIGGWYGLLREPELFVRWTQAGVMSSHTRFHGTTPREPWIFGEDIEKIIKDWIEFRYRLIPYLRSCEQEACRTGLPVMRSMALAFPNDRAAWAFEEQYMLGSALLVAPIIKPGGSVDVYLPEGDWYQLWDGKPVRGGQMLSLNEFPIEDMPIFGRKGTLLPLGPVVQYTDQLKDMQAIDEVWLFGTPDPQIAVLSEGITFDTRDEKLHVPEKVKVKQF